MQLVRLFANQKPQMYFSSRRYGQRKSSSATAAASKPGLMPQRYNSNDTSFSASEDLK